MTPSRVFAFSLLLATSPLHLPAANKTWSNGAGNSTWNTSSVNWSGSTWAVGDYAILGATGVGAINVSGTQIATGIQFDTTGYTLSGGTLQLNSVGGDYILFGSTGDGTIQSAIALGGNNLNRIATNSGITLTLNGAISDGGSAYGVFVGGAPGFTGSLGKVVLGGVNTYTGATTLQNGVLSLNASGGYALSGNLLIQSLDSWAVNNGTNMGVELEADDQIVHTSIVTFNPGAGTYAAFRPKGHTVTVGGLSDATGRGVIENTSYGQTGTFGGGIVTVDVASGSYSFNGFFRNNGGGSGTGTLALTKEGAGTQVLSGGNLLYTGPTLVSKGRLVVAGSIATSASVSVASGATLEVSGTAYNQLASGAGKSWTVAGTLANTGAANVLTLAETITLNGGTLTSTTSGGATFGSYHVVNNTIAANGTNNTISAVDFGIAGGRTLTLATPLAGDTLTASTKFKDVGGAGALIKTGAGTLILSGDNSYSGSTAINGGTLIINGNTTGDGLITASSTATLGGNGTMKNVDIASSGTLSPGSSSGTITIENLSLGADSILKLELDDPSAASDKVVVTNTLLLGGSVSLHVSGLPGLAAQYTVGTQWLVMEYNSLIGGNLGNVTVGSDGTGLGLTVDSTTAGKVYLTATTVPEPGVGALLALGLLFLRRRFKR